MEAINTEVQKKSKMKLQHYIDMEAIIREVQKKSMIHIRKTRHSIEIEKDMRHGVYLSLSEIMAKKKPSRELPVSESTIAEQRYKWKIKRSYDHPERGPLLSNHKSTVSLLETEKLQFMENGRIVDVSGKVLHFGDLQRMQQRNMIRSVLEEKSSFLPTRPSRAREDYNKINLHHNLISSPHALINKYRAKRNLLPLIRESKLDELATEQAKRIATRSCKEHSNVNNIVTEIWNPSAPPFRMIGENVGGGKSIVEIIEKMVNDPKYEADRNNLYEPTYSFFGVGIATNSKGKLYSCQIYKG